MKIYDYPGHPKGPRVPKASGAFLTPQLAVLLATAAIMAALTIWALWERSGRLSCEVARVEVTVAYSHLAAQVAEQNAKVRQLAQAGAQAREAGRQATIAAEVKAQAMAGEIEALRARIAAPTPAGEDCRNVWAEIQRAVRGAK